MALDLLVVEGGIKGADARLVRNSKGGIIRLRQGLSPAGRRRFAIAHELGHWRLHREKSQLFVCTEADLRDYSKSALEVEANTFAAGLLMPAPVFCEARTGERPSQAEVQSLADEFACSRTAIAVRWMELADDHCAAVFSQGGRVRWWRGSGRWEEEIRIQFGALSRFSAAAKLDPDVPGSSSGEQDVSADAWLENAEDLDLDTLIEESFVLDGRGTVVSLLWVA